MKKNRYISPATEVINVTVENRLMTMSSTDTHIPWGGNASDNDSPEPYSENQDWGIWR
ncbi:MAG: hypothetical protein NC388_11105 [Clostridium sp.]|nr:hypothetical protein [Clostridium sp.]